MHTLSNVFILLIENTDSSLVPCYVIKSNFFNKHNITIFVLSFLVVESGIFPI